MGVCYEEGQGVKKDPEKAFHYFKLAAESGYPDAVYYLGNCYYNGRGVEQDLFQAYSWHRKGAELGNIYAMTDLATMDYGIQTDEYEKLRLLEKAAETGYECALYFLALRFLAGDEYVIKDEKTALELLKKAAHKNHALSYYMLFKCYYFGMGTCKNDSLAVKYLQKAVVFGNKNAKRVLKKIQSSG